MKGTAILCALLGVALARPDGYFHQQYQYKSSSSSFKDNELEHKKDDEGYYSRQGDLEGRSEPKVNSYSQHSEYNNPKFQHGQSAHGQVHGLPSDDFYIQQTSGLGRDGSSGSNYNSQLAFGSANAGLGSGSHQGYQNGLSGGLHGTAATSGTSYKSGYSMSSTYGSSASGGGSLYPTGQLAVLSQQLQNDLSRQLQNAINEQQQRYHSSSSSHSSYGSSSSSRNYGVNINLQLLEEELKNNLTKQLQDALHQQFGQQNQRGSQFYSITSSGSQSSQPNYSTHELQSLRQQLENNLIKQLQEGAQTHSLQSSRTSSSSSSTSFGSGTTEYDSHGTADTHSVDLTPGSHRQDSFGSLTTHRSGNIHQHGTSYGVGSSNSHGSSSSYSTHGVTGTDSVPLTDITRDLERNLADQITDALNQRQHKYSQSSSSFLTSYSTSGSNIRPSYETELRALTDELKHNLTRQLDDELIKNYGRQEQRGSYYYTISSGSRHSTPNYRTDDLTELKQQLQDKLLRKLQEQLRQQYSQYTHTSQESSQFGTTGYQPSTDYRPTSHGSSHTSYESTRTHSQYHTTGTSDSYPTNGNSQTYRTGVSDTSGSSYPVTTGSQTHGSFGMTGYTRQSGSEYTPGIFVIRGDAPVELQDVTKDVHTDLTRQLHAALAEQQRRYQQQQHAYTSTSASYAPQADYQVILQQLTDELKRNITQHLGQSLTKHYGQQGQRGSSYYTVSGGNYNTSPNYNSQQLNDIRQQLQDSLIQQLQHGLSQQYSSYSSYSSSSSFKKGSHISGSGASYTSGSYPTYSDGGSYQLTYGSSGSCGQCESMQGDDSFSTRSNHETANAGGLTQKAEQTEEVINKMKLENLNLQQAPQKYGQVEIEGQQKTVSQEADLMQQTEDEFGQLQLGDQQKTEDLTQQQEHLTRLRKDDFEKLQIGSHQKEEGGKSTYSSGKYGGQEQIDLTQHTEDGFAQLHIGEHKLDLIQQQEDLIPQTGQGSGKLQVGSQQVTSGVDDDLTQQFKLAIGGTSSYEKLQIEGQQQTDLTQQQQNSEDLTQQTEDDHGKLQIGGQYQSDLTQQQEDTGDLTQQTEEGHGKLQIGSQQQTDLIQQQEQVLDLTHQTEEDHVKVQIGSQQKQLELTQQDDLTQQYEELDLIQKTESHDKLQIGQQQTDLANQQDDLDLTQQIEGQGKLQIGSHGKLQNGGQQVDLTQQQEALDLTQQTEGDGKLQFDSYGKLETTGHQTDGSQEVGFGRMQQMQNGFGGKLRSGSSQEILDITEQHETDLTQQQQFIQQTDNRFRGKLQIGGNGKLNFENQQPTTGYGFGQTQVNTQYSRNHRTAGQIGFGNQQHHSEGYYYQRQGSIPFNDDQYRYHDQGRYSTYSSGSQGYGSQSKLFAEQQGNDNLVLQQNEKQNAQLLENLNEHVHSQKQSGYSQSSYSSYSSSSNSSSHSSSYGGHESSSQESTAVAKADAEPVITVTQEVGASPAAEQGFWSKVGSKIGDTYSSAKQKAGSFIDKISTSVG